LTPKTLAQNMVHLSDPDPVKRQSDEAFMTHMLIYCPKKSQNGLKEAVVN
jgi:hypothetical protein